MAGLVLPAFTAGVIVGVTADCHGVPRYAWLACASALCLATWRRVPLMLFSPGTRRRWATAGLALAGAIAGAAAVARIDAMAPHSIALYSGQAVVIQADVVRATPKQQGSRLTLARVQVADDAGLYQERSGLLELDLPSSLGQAVEGTRVQVAAELWPVPRRMNPSELDWKVSMLAKGVHASGRAVGGLVELGKARRGPLSVASQWLRSAGLQAAETLPPDEASVLRGLLLGDSSQLSPELRRSFSAAGVSHLLAASGLHLGIVYALVCAATARPGLPPWAAPALATVGGLVYAGAVGFKASIVRALLVLCVANAAALVGRVPSPLHTVCLAACVQVLWQPALLWDLGFRLSYAAFCAVVVMSRTARERRLKGTVAALATSASVCAVTWPVVAGVDGRVSLIGPVANLVAIPLASLALLGGMAGALLGAVVPAAGAVIAQGAGCALSALIACVRLAAAVPFSEVRVGAPSGLSCVAYYSALAGAFAAWEDPIRAARLVRILRRHRAVCGVVALAAVRGAAAPGGFRLTALYVGQGDAILIRSPAGACVLVDSGPPAFGESQLAPFLARQGVHHLDVAVITHEHADHAGGLRAVAGVASIGVLAVGQGMPEDEVDRLLAAATSDGRRPELLVMRRGQVLRVGDLTFEVLHPDGLEAATPNARSVVLRLAFRDFSCLLCADAGATFETWATTQTQLQADLLKVAHHGSSSASSWAFLSAVSPRWAVVSVGPNRYGHPSPEVMERLSSAGAEAYRTDVSGAVEVRTNRLTGGARLVTFGEKRSVVPMFRRLRSITK